MIRSSCERSHSLSRCFNLWRTKSRNTVGTGYLDARRTTSRHTSSSSLYWCVSSFDYRNAFRQIIQRRIALDNPGCFEVKSTDDQLETETSSADSASPPGAKKSKNNDGTSTRRGGRPAAGEDYWSIVEAWLEGKIAKLGPKITGPRWIPCVHY